MEQYKKKGNPETELFQCLVEDVSTHRSICLKIIAPALRLLDS